MTCRSSCNSLQDDLYHQYLTSTWTQQLASVRMWTFQQLSFYACFVMTLRRQTLGYLAPDRIMVNGETHGRNILSSPRWRQSSTTHRAKIKRDITRSHKRTLSWASIWIMRLCISNIVLCPHRPHKLRWAAASGRARKSINVYGCTSSILVTAAPPCHRSTTPLNPGTGLIRN